MIITSEIPMEQLIIGHSPAIVALREQIRRYGPAPLSVLIYGPSGAGKELVAQALHSTSRRKGAFVPCNIPSFSEGLFEDTMFGHVKGAFTGAINAKAGIFREAAGGTVFLDEVAQLRPSGQVSLLRALESRVIRPVGGSQEYGVDFRLVAATNEPLRSLVQQGVFRDDLYQRLAGSVIRVPALYERRDDIPELVAHFAKQFTTAHPRYLQAIFSPAAITRLCEYTWPGNIRELKSVVESLICLCDAGKIHERNVQILLADRHELGIASLDTERRVKLLQTLAQYNNNIGAVAVHYQRTKATVYRWLQEYGIRTPERVHRVLPATRTYSRDIHMQDVNKCE